MLLISKRYSNAKNKFLIPYDPKDPRDIFGTLTKIIYSIMLCQNLFQRVSLHS